MARVKDSAVASPRKHGKERQQSGSGDAVLQGHQHDLEQTAGETPPRPPLDLRLAQMTRQYHHLMDKLEQDKLVEKRALTRSRSRSRSPVSSRQRSRSVSRTRSRDNKKRSRAASSSSSSSRESSPRRKRKGRSKKRSKKSKKGKKKRRRSPSSSSSSSSSSSETDSSDDDRRLRKKLRKRKERKDRKQSEAILAKFAKFLDETVSSEDAERRPEEGEIVESDASVDDWAAVLTVGKPALDATPAPTSKAAKKDQEKVQAAQAEAAASGVDPEKVAAFGRVLAVAHDAFDEQVVEGDPINKSYAKIVEAALR